VTKVTTLSDWPVRVLRDVIGDHWSRCTQGGAQVPHTVTPWLPIAGLEPGDGLVIPKKTPASISLRGLHLEAPVGIEPTDRGRWFMLPNLCFFYPSSLIS